MSGVFSLFTTTGSTTTIFLLLLQVTMNAKKASKAGCSKILFELPKGNIFQQSTVAGRKDSQRFKKKLTARPVISPSGKTGFVRNLDLVGFQGCKPQRLNQ